MDEGHEEGVCAMVRIEWDRGHASTEAIIRAQHEGGIIISTIHDHVPLPGLKWIRASELLYIDNLEPLADDHPAVRLAALHGSRQLRLSHDLADLDVLVADLRDAQTLVLVNVRRTGSGSGDVGRLTGVTATQLVLDEVSTAARYTGEQLHISIDDVIAIEWGDNYLMAIDQLLIAEATSS